MDYNDDYLYDDHNDFFDEDSSNYHPDAAHEIATQFDDENEEDDVWEDDYDDSMDGDWDSGMRDEVNDVLKPSYNGINAGGKTDKSRRHLDYGQEKPVNSPR